MVAGEACGQPDGMLVKRPCSASALRAAEKAAERSERRIPGARSAPGTAGLTGRWPAAGQRYGSGRCWPVLIRPEVCQACSILLIASLGAARSKRMRLWLASRDS